MAKTKIKRIFLTGAPGSRWSRVDRILRACLVPKTDYTDVNEHRDWHGHRGAYWNPGNEPGYDWILNFASYSKEHIIETLDSVFSPIPEGMDTIVRIHKSHYFSYHLDKIHELFPDDAIVVVSQTTHMCFLWWQICGGHDTVFDSYHYYQRDYDSILNEIVKQNAAIDNFIEKQKIKKNYLTLELLEENFGKLSDVFLERWNHDILYDNGEYNIMTSKSTNSKFIKTYGHGLLNDNYVSIIPWANT